MKIRSIDMFVPNVHLKHNSIFKLMQGSSNCYKIFRESKDERWVKEIDKLSMP